MGAGSSSNMTLLVGSHVVFSATARICGLILDLASCIDLSHHLY